MGYATKSQVQESIKWSKANFILNLVCWGFIFGCIIGIVRADVSVVNKDWIFPLLEPSKINGKIICTDWCSNIRYENGKSYKYMAVNYPAKYGTPIIAPCDAIVENTHIGGYEGATITLRVNESTTITFCHLSNYEELSNTKIIDFLTGKKWKVKTQVKKGDIIGYVGQSGRTTGSHLRVRVEVNGERAFINPTTWGLKIEDVYYRQNQFCSSKTKMYGEV